MRLPEPPPARWELHGRMFGAGFRVHPLFWVSCALLGVVYYQYPDIRQQMGGLAAFLLWMAAAVAALAVHELGHVLVSRLFGVRPRLVVSGLGGQLFGLEELSRWRRVLVALAGPLMNALLFGAMWGVTALPLPPDWRVALAPAVWVLMWINAFWGLLNVLPLWPLDGGRIAVELGMALFGRHGRTLALLLSLAVSLLLTVFVIAWMRLTLYPFDDRYTVYFTYFCILSLYCYVFWLSAFRALWDESEPPSGQK